jgi:hypothetical protein
MKNKYGVKNFLFLPFSRKQLTFFWPVFNGFSIRRAVCRAVHLVAMAVVLSFLLPVTLLRAEDKVSALLENITFDRESSVRETIAFKLNGPYIPKIFAVKGDAPKVVFDFNNTRESPSIKAVMKSRGNLIAAIRTAMHTDPQLKTRVVLDLVPAGDYDFSMDFNKKDNILLVTIFHAQQKKETPAPESTAGKSKKTEPVPAKVVSPVEKVKKEAVSVPPVKEKKVEKPSVPSPVVPAEKPPVSSSKLVINKISFEQSPDKGEKVLFQLTNFHPPVIFGVEEGNPSIVCDFIDAKIEDNVPGVISAKGEFVKQVRVEKTEKSHKIRVVLDLVPNRHYDLQQVYFKEENLYVLFVKSPDRGKVERSSKPL